MCMSLHNMTRVNDYKNLFLPNCMEYDNEVYCVIISNTSSSFLLFFFHTRDVTIYGAVGTITEIVCLDMSINFPIPQLDIHKVIFPQDKVSFHDLRDVIYFLSEPFSQTIY